MSVCLALYLERTSKKHRSWPEVFFYCIALLLYFKIFVKILLMNLKGLPEVSKISWWYLQCRHYQGPLIWINNKSFQCLNLNLSTWPNLEFLKKVMIKIEPDFTKRIQYWWTIKHVQIDLLFLVKYNCINCRK